MTLLTGEIFPFRKTFVRGNKITASPVSKEWGTGVTLTEQTKSRRFQELLLPHLDAAYNLARWLTRNDQDAEDVVQEACLRAFRAFDGFRGERGRPWLLAIVRNACYDWLRQHRKDGLSENYEDELHGGAEPATATPMAGGNSDPETALSRADDRRFVNDALQKLPVEFREVVILRDIEALSYK
jgi:RNA polymerase sigma factor (sigma-70 family)